MNRSKLKTRLFFLTLPFFLYSCEMLLPSSLKTDEWYRTYTGKAGNREIVLHLSKAGNYNGYLWFKDTHYPVMIYSDPTITTEGDSIYLSGGNAALWITLKGILKESMTGEMSVQTNGIQDPAEKFNLEPNASFTAFNFIQTKDSAKLPEQLNNQSTFKYFIGTVWPLEKDLITGKLTIPIKNLLGMPASETNITRWMDSTQISSLEKWKTDGNKLSREDAEMMGMSFSKQVHNLLSVLYENKETITLAYYVYSFEGGAHGNYSTTLVNIDKASGKKLSPEDLLTPEGIKALPDLLHQAARKQYRITNNKSLESNGFFTNKIEPGKNFYITSAGIGFYYSPYAIKPFSYGEINLFIPKEWLSDYRIK